MSAPPIDRSRLGAEAAGPVASLPSVRSRPRRVQLLPLRPGWPLFALLVLFPLWWALGLANLILPIIGVCVTVALLRRGVIRIPPYFLLWALFLLWVLISAVALGHVAPGTIPGSATRRLPAYALRFSQYLSATAILLYVGSFTERELPKARIVRMLGIFFLSTVAGGLLGTFLPNLNFTSLVEALLPDWVKGHQFVIDLVHPRTSQLQDVLGYVSPRPSAPFTYTNAWGHVTSILLIWFAVWTWRRRARMRQAVFLVVVAIASIPIVYSLNRGVWIGLTLALVYLAVRLAIRGRAAVLAGLMALLAVGVALFLLSPLQGIVKERLAHQHSNAGRASQSVAAVKGALTSPVIGYGSTRAQIGSNQSITVGRTAGCRLCGNAAIGGAGEFWLVLFAQGFLGALFYVSYFVLNLWRHRRDVTPIGLGGTLVLLLSLFYMFLYGVAGMPLVLYFVSIALLWRNELDAKAQVPRPERLGSAALTGA